VKATSPNYVLLFVSSVVALFCASCASQSQEQVIANEQSRLRQQEKGVFDREDSAQQRKAEERAQAERQREKS